LSVLKKQSQLAKHKIIIYRYELKVKKFSILRFSRKSKERTKVIVILGKQNNFKFNTNPGIPNLYVNVILLLCTATI